MSREPGIYLKKYGNWHPCFHSQSPLAYCRIEGSCREQRAPLGPRETRIRVSRLSYVYSRKRSATQQLPASCHGFPLSLESRCLMLKHSRGPRHTPSYEKGTREQLNHIHAFHTPCKLLWRCGWDLNPRYLSVSPVFKTGSLNHSDTTA